MTLMWAQYGLVWAAGQTAYGTAGAGYGVFCRLYTNNYTPVETSTTGNFTQASFTGYAAIQLNNWSTPAYSSGKGVTTNAVVTFTNSSGSPVTIYGYFCSDTTNTNLWFAERDASAPITLNPGDSYAITIEVNTDNP